MSNNEMISQFFREELQEQNVEIPKNINIDCLEKDFVDFLNTDLYDWYKSNFNSFISGLILSDWDKIPNNE